MPRKAFFTRFPGFRLPAPFACANGCAALTIGGRRKIKYPRLASPSFRAQTRNLWNLAVWTSTAPESIFVASACEYGVAVQGDGHMRRSLRFSKGRHHFENMFPSTGSGNGPLQSRTSCSLLPGRLRSLSGASLRPFHLAVRSLR